MRRAGPGGGGGSVLGRPHPDVPLDDDVILFVVLAAGLRPVMAPVSANSGTIDPAAVPDATWSSLCGVLTTNLYGLPDRVAELRAPHPTVGSTGRLAPCYRPSSLAWSTLRQRSWT